MFEDTRISVRGLEQSRKARTSARAVIDVVYSRTDARAARQALSFIASFVCHARRSNYTMEEL